MEKVNETNNVATKTPTTRTKKATTSKVKTRTVDDINVGDRVVFDNLANWSVSFVSEETGKDILIPGGVTKFMKLNVAEVDSQVRIGNPAFCGTDGYGTHAIFRISDPVMREKIFGEDVNPIQLTKEAVEELLETEPRAKFEKALSELVVTESEKRRIVSLCEEIGLESVVSYKMAAIERISGVNFD